MSRRRSTSGLPPPDVARRATWSRQLCVRQTAWTGLRCSNGPGTSSPRNGRNGSTTSSRSTWTDGGWGNSRNFLISPPRQPSEPLLRWAMVETPSIDPGVLTLYEAVDAGRALNVTPGMVPRVRGLVPVARTPRGVRLDKPEDVERVRQEREARRRGSQLDSRAARSARSLFGGRSGRRLAAAAAA